ncbi:porin [Hydrogenophaga luteola]|uniref:Porin n=1 Tax=Hydrogenophaga luteola TaxID=1591122 RepID=A0ABV7WC98_9BURK
MKKSLIALAVLGSVAGVAQAQSSVSVYGVADAVLHKDKGVSAALTSGGVSGSRLGFKGTEDLGGGLKANFLLEHGFKIDTGMQGQEGASFNRQAYVGLSGGFGEFKLGRIWTAYDDISGATNPVFDSVLSPTNVWASSGYAANPSNGIYYASPAMGGVSGAFSTNLKEGSGNQSNAFHVKYEGGPVYAGVAYQVDKTATGDTKFTRVNGSYDLGAAKLLAGYGNVKAGSVKTTDLTFGADVPLGANLVLSAGYASSKTDGAERLSGLGLGVAYSLSKRTTVYGGFLDTKNTGPDTRYGFGLKHTF